MRDEIVGREYELRAASVFLDTTVRGPAALVYAGDPGMGKTTMWMEAVEKARERAVLVLSARPVAAEAGLAFAALADLLEPVAGDVLAGLPEPQQRALAVALLRKDPGRRGLDQRAVGAATLSVLTALTRAGPVLVAIDDLQWLDRSSAQVLTFALRRRGPLRVGLLACAATMCAAFQATVAKYRRQVALRTPGGAAELRPRRVSIDRPDAVATAVRDVLAQ